MKHERWKHYPCGREWANKSDKCTSDSLCAWCHHTKLVEGEVHNTKIELQMMKKARDLLYEEIKMSTNDQIEKEIQNKGLTAERVTPFMIENAIVGCDYHVFEGSQLTVCCLTLKNGFTVTGESACASPENFDADIGKKIAYTNAKEKIWVLEGYLLKEKIAAMNYFNDTNKSPCDGNCKGEPGKK